MSRMIPVILFGFALALWGLVGASLAGYLPAQGTGIMNSVAAACLVLAGISLMLEHLRNRVRDADKDALVVALADITRRRGLARTKPLKRVV